jgi:uncharacterized protein
VKINIDEIPESGLDVQEKLDPGKLGLAIQNRIVYDSPLDIQAHVTKMTGDIRVQGMAEAHVLWSCSFCLKMFRKLFQQRFDLHYPNKETIEFIDPTDLIREEILLAYPIQMKCQKNCKGLCSQCGNNLNENPCQCRKSSNSPFDKLKDIVE